MLTTVLADLLLHGFGSTSSSSASSYSSPQMYTAIKNRVKIVLKLKAVNDADLTECYERYTVMKDLQCPAYDAIQILQEKWVLLIVRALLDSPKGFNELGRDIGGCNPTTLAQRLERLEQLGLVNKKVEAIMPPKSSYSLTEAGHGLQCVVEAIHVWAVKHLPETMAVTS